MYHLQALQVLRLLIAEGGQPKMTMKVVRKAIKN
jgi:hypothetical protein